MLNEQTINRLAALSKVKPEDLKAALISTEEVDITIDESLTAFKEDELKTLKDNEYKKGKQVGIEMEVKEAKEKHGIDTPGKTLDSLMEGYKGKVIKEAKIDPDKKVTELEGKITTLQTTVTDYEKKLADKDSEVTTVKINGELHRYIPAPGENGPALGADDIIQLMRVNGYEFKFENGKTVPYKNGQQMQDKLSNPRESKDVVSEFMTEKKLIVETKVIGGRGGTDGGQTTKYTKLSELKKTFQDQGKSLIGSEFSEAASKAVKEYPEFDMNN